MNLKQEPEVGLMDEAADDWGTHPLPLVSQGETPAFVVGLKTLIQISCRSGGVQLDVDTFLLLPRPVRHV